MSKYLSRITIFNENTRMCLHMYLQDRMKTGGYVGASICSKYIGSV